MANRFKSVQVNAGGVYESLKDLPHYVAINAIGQAVSYALRPEISKVKMQIGVAMAGGVSAKGIADYKRAISIKVKKRKNLGVAYGLVGADRETVAQSSHNLGKATKWSRLAHLFEFGTKRGIPAMPAIGVVQENDKAVIMDRYRGYIQTAIMGQVKKYDHNKAAKAAK